MSNAPNLATQCINKMKEQQKTKSENFLKTYKQPIDESLLNHNFIDYKKWLGDDVFKRIDLSDEEFAILFKYLESQGFKVTMDRFCSGEKYVSAELPDHNE